MESLEWEHCGGEGTLVLTSALQLLCVLDPITLLLWAFRIRDLSKTSPIPDTIGVLKFRVLHEEPPQFECPRIKHPESCHFSFLGTLSTPAPFKLHPFI